MHIIHSDVYFVHCICVVYKDLCEYNTQWLHGTQKIIFGFDEKYSEPELGLLQIPARMSNVSVGSNPFLLR